MGKIIDYRTEEQKITHSVLITATHKILFLEDIASGCPSKCAWACRPEHADKVFNWAKSMECIKDVKRSTNEWKPKANYVYIYCIPDNHIALKEGKNRFLDNVNYVIKGELKDPIYDNNVCCLRHSDDNWTVPETIEHGVMTNYWGIVALKKSIDFLGHIKLTKDEIVYLMGFVIGDEKLKHAEYNTRRGFKK
jgi:hypothetical protein